jgi:hypothetical protein
MGLGDKVEQALKTVGITEERVSRWLGRPCGCRGRKEKLNKLGNWMARVLGGGATPEEGRKELAEMTGDASIAEPSTVEEVPVQAVEQAEAPPVEQPEQPPVSS